MNSFSSPRQIRQFVRGSVFYHRRPQRDNRRHHHRGERIPAARTCREIAELKRIENEIISAIDRSAAVPITGTYLRADGFPRGYRKHIVRSHLREVVYTRVGFNVVQRCS